MDQGFDIYTSLQKPDEGPSAHRRREAFWQHGQEDFKLKFDVHAYGTLIDVRHPGPDS